MFLEKGDSQPAYLENLHIVHLDSYICDIQTLSFFKRREESRRFAKFTFSVQV